MTKQSRDRIAAQSTDPGYWKDYAEKFPSKAKTRAAAEVAIEMETRGKSGVTETIRGILEEVVRLARGGPR